MEQPQTARRAPTPPSLRVLGSSERWLGREVRLVCISLPRPQICRKLGLCFDLLLNAGWSNDARKLLWLLERRLLSKNTYISGTINIGLKAFIHMQEAPVHEGVQRALSSPLSTSYNGSASPLARANSAGLQTCYMSTARKGFHAPSPLVLTY